MVQAVRTQADKQRGMQGWPVVLHIISPGPGTGTETTPEWLWTVRQVQWSLLAQCHLCQGQKHSHQRRGEGRQAGRKLLLSGGWWRSDNHPMCWVRGTEEGVRHSERWNTTKFLRQSAYRKVGYIALSNWDTQMARRESKAHEGKEAIESCQNNPGFLNPNLVPHPRDHAALHISLRHFLFCLYSQCLKISAVFVLQTGPFGNGPRVWIWIPN